MAPAKAAKALAVAGRPKATVAGGVAAASD
jgi:hypothetical protein